MLAQTGGRLLPLAPASAAAAVGMLTAGFAPATGAAVSVGAVATFMVGMSTILTITGAALTAAIVCLTAGPGRRGRRCGTPPRRGGLPAPPRPEVHAEPFLRRATRPGCGSPHRRMGGCTADAEPCRA